MSEPTKPKRKANAKRSDPDLAVGASFVVYELNAMLSAVPFVGTDQDWRVERLAVEGVLLHARTLTEFLSPRPKSWHPDDVRITDFESEPLPASTAIADWELGALRDLIDNRLAHISYKRVEIVGWPIGKIAFDVSKLVRRFVDELPVDRQKWFTNDPRWPVEPRV